MNGGTETFHGHYQMLQSKTLLYFDILFGAIHVVFLAVFSTMTSNPDNYGDQKCPSVLLDWGQYAFFYHASGFILCIFILTSLYCVISNRAEDSKDSSALIQVTRLIRLIEYLAGVAIFIGICVTYNQDCYKLSQLCLAYLIIWSVFLLITIVVVVMVVKKARDHGMDTHSSFVSFVYFD